MNQSYSSNQKSQNAKFVIVTALVTLVVLGIAVWGIVFVANYQNRGKNEVSYTDSSNSSSISTTDQTEATSPEGTEPESTEGASATVEGGDASSDAQKSDNAELNSPSAVGSTCPPNCKNKNTNNDSSVSGNTGATKANNGGSAASSVPDTGPEDILPVALLFGTFIAFLTSQKLVKRDII